MIDQLSGHFEAVREDNTALLAMLEEKRDAAAGRRVKMINNS